LSWLSEAFVRTLAWLSGGSHDRGERERRSFGGVLQAELEEIARRRVGRKVSVPRRPRPTSGDPVARAHRAGLVGLAFSGGGIRSASFNLGVLQGLAELRILHLFDYLSTVSGGGYIGSWLQAWTRRRGFSEVHDALHPDYEKHGGRSPWPIEFLREYSSYLTPRRGTFGLDTWAAIMLWVANTSLNLFILGLTTSALLLVPKVLSRVPILSLIDMEHLTLALICLAMVVIGTSLSGVSAEGRARDSNLPTPLVHLLVVLPILLSAWLIGAKLPEFPARTEVGFLGTLVPGAPAGVLWALASAQVYTLSWIATYMTEFLGTGRRPGRADLIILTTAFAAGGVAGPVLTALARALVAPSLLAAPHGIFRMAVVIAVFILTTVIHVGLAGTAFTDDAREWWSRLNASLALNTLLLCALAAISCSPAIAAQMPDPIERFGHWPHWLTAGLGWLFTTGVGLYVGQSPVAQEKRSGPIRLLTRIAPTVFVLGVLVMNAYALHGLARAFLPALTPGRPWLQGPFGPLAAIGLLLTLATVLSWRIGINEFSMHGLYRNRLVRCYLGASNFERRPHPFTGFDPDDGRITIDELGTKPGPLPADARIQDDWGPYPIVNTTLNLVHGRRLAWQTRKAASFVMTPLYCGYELSIPEENGDAGRQPRDYRPTAEYAGRLHLGEAMAISGAAASPNMGRASTPSLGFLMTVFNLRLGWWLPNPRNSVTWCWRRPPAGLLYLGRELLGYTNEHSSFVYLSDGGHFENLGIYELVRRRCRFIVACDAGQDENRCFVDLAGAIEKCRTDFGIDIEIDLEALRAGPKGRSARHCAIGRVRYDKADQAATFGTLVYLKASLTGDEPGDVEGYAAQNPAFPHESTADQWFDEDQLESYRALGQHVVSTVFSSAVDTGVEPGEAEVLFRRLRQTWHPTSLRVQESFTRHGADVSRIFELIRKTDKARFLDSQIYPGWPELMTHAVGTGAQAGLWIPEDPEAIRQGFYICSQMLQLMENVYLDMHLEEEYGHPDNRGWMNLFRHWSWSSMVRVTWAMCASTYGARFQRFCEHRLGLGLEGFKATRLDTEADVQETLNFVERRFRQDYEAVNRGALPTTYALQLLVHDPTQERPPGHPGQACFTFGFALVTSGILRYVRVQDHLRRMGFAREGLRALQKETGDLELPRWDDDTPLLGADTLEPPARNDYDRVARLLDSLACESVTAPPVVLAPVAPALAPPAEPRAAAAIENNEDDAPPAP
jgi:predicted acylesterase/phospholipase RssA